MPRPTLFDSNAFLFQEGQPRSLSMIIAIDIATGRVLGKLGLEVEGNAAASTSKAPYGLFWWETKEVRDRLLMQTQSLLLHKGIERLNWRNAPDCYGREEDWLENWQETWRETFQNTAIEDSNFHLNIQTSTTFKHLLPADQARALAKAKAAIGKIEVAESPDWEVIFPIYEASRTAKGFEQSMTLVSFKTVQSNLSAAYKVIVCYEKSGLVAGWALLVEVSKETFYLFITANNPARHGSYSPTLAIIEFAYHNAQQNGGKILDLGTASKEGEVNEGVFAFKKSIGAVLGSKKTHLISIDKLDRKNEGGF